VSKKFLKDANASGDTKWSAKVTVIDAPQPSPTTVIDAKEFWGTFITGAIKCEGKCYMITDVDINDVYTEIKEVR